MKPEHAELWERIEGFRIGESGSELTFVERLARDNCWPLEYAWRVVCEYKRFAFLSVVAGHAVTPSEDVDEAWHLHLVYTRSYWDEFCPVMLGRSLHHEPTRGGEAEHHKHTDWYRRTLTSYERFFGPPPTDIWPPVDRFSPRFHRVRVERDRYWFIPKRAGTLSAKFALIVFALTGLGFAPLWAQIANPLDMRGPEFLSLYMAVAVIAVVIGAIVRWRLRAPGSGNAADKEPTQYHPYEIAWLVGGQARAVDAALTGLVADGALNFSAANKSVEVKRPLSPQQHPLEKEIVRAAQADGSLRVLRAAMKTVEHGWTEKLRQRGLLITDERSSIARWIPAILVALVALLGIAKIAVGISRDKPVAILVLLVIITLIVAALFAGKKPFRSRFGDQVMKAARGRHESLRKPNWSASNLSGMDAALAVALFSSLALQGSQYDPLRSALSSPASTGGGCGGTGCGGGGGGGCGGGGCGGCGGGD